MTHRPQTRKRPTREEKRQANRERILAAARQVFGARGYQAATIEQIADEAGLSNGAIYYNFASREELFMALLDARSRERLEHAREAVTAEHDPLSARRAVEREALDVTRTFKEHREWRLLLLEFVGYAARNPEFGKRLKDHEDELHKALVWARTPTDGTMSDVTDDTSDPLCPGLPRAQALRRSRRPVAELALAAQAAKALGDPTRSAVALALRDGWCSTT